MTPKLINTKGVSLPPLPQACTAREPSQTLLPCPDAGRAGADGTPGSVTPWSESSLHPVVSQISMSGPNPILERTSQVGAQVLTGDFMWN